MKKLFGELILGINYIQIDNTNINSLIPEIQMPCFGYEKKISEYMMSATDFFFKW